MPLANVPPVWIELPLVVVTETVPPSAASPGLVAPQKMAEQSPVEPPAPPRLCALMPLESAALVAMVPVKLTVTELPAPPWPPSPGSPPRLASTPPPLPPLPAALTAAKPTDEAPTVKIAPLTVTLMAPPLPPLPPLAALPPIKSLPPPPPLPATELAFTPVALFVRTAPDVEMVMLAPGCV